MESIQHLKISIILSPIIAVPSFGSLQTPEFLAVSFLGIGLGTLIDLDHFLWARINNGNWKHFKKSLYNPKTIITDNQELMDDALKNKQRYISHLIILWIGQLALLISYELGLFTVSMIGSHIATDLYSSARDRELDQESSEKQSQD